MDDPTFRLARGSTGFGQAGDLPMPQIDVKLCRTAWHAAARAAGGRVGEFVERRYPRTFHSATLTDRGGAHVALFHAGFALVAFVAEQRDWYTDEFRDPPSWAGVLDGFGLALLPASLLLAPLSEADTTGLSAAEWSQIAYWRPETLGATLFNAWD
ncbi:hypothetical protein ACIBH1_02800 [Nonomuraea sp. NPDC050663]|uniref:hypothetical protein n=1 Tax=Nonomuraea sp. NPDC050663 TaxID=3364370 RepID=UPI0037A001F2